MEKILGVPMRIETLIRYCRRLAREKYIVPRNWYERKILKILEKEGVVKREKVGKVVRYRLAKSRFSLGKVVVDINWLDKTVNLHVEVKY